MPDAIPPPWRLLGFEELFEAWLHNEDLAGYGDIELIVWQWIHSRLHDPYAGVRRERGFGNHWWGTIPRSADNLGRVVTCSYFVNESERTVRCATIGWHVGPFI